MRCNGRGFNNCTACAGAGSTRIQRSRLGFNGRTEYYYQQLPCSGCAATGRIRCVFCNGAGRVPQSGTKPQPTQNPVAQDASPTTQAVWIPQEFKFVPEQFARHPSTDGTWATLWQSGALDVGVSWMPAGRFYLDGFQRDRWLNLTGEKGEVLPLRIFVPSAGAVRGMWV
jgi:hypothetical protein